MENRLRFHSLGTMYIFKRFILINIMTFCEEILIQEFQIYRNCVWCFELLNMDDKENI